MKRRRERQRVLLIGDPGKLPMAVFGLAREWFAIAAEHELASMPQLFDDTLALNLASEVDVDVYLEHAQEIKKWAREIVRMHGPFDGIVAPSEYTISVGAWLREQLGVPGWDTSDASRVRDKGVMKALIARAGVSTAGFIDLAQTNDPNAIEIWAAARPGKVVLKPKNQAGSRGVRVFDDARTLRAAVSDMPVEARARHIAEDFVSGHLLHIDGLVRGGELCFLSASRYLAPCLSWLKDRQAMGSVLISEPKLLDRIVRFTRETLVALALDDAVFHLEAFNDGGALTFLEIAGRPGGAAIVPHLRSRYGIDLVEEMVRCDLGLPARASSNGALNMEATLPNGGWIATSMPTAAPCRVVGIVGLDSLPSSVFLSDTPPIGERFNLDGDEGKASARFHVATSSEVETEGALRAIDACYRLMLQPM